MRNISIIMLAALTLTACGEKETEETTDTGLTEDTAVTEDTGEVEETDTEETDTEETDTEDTEETDTEETDTEDTSDTEDTEDTDTEEPDPMDVDDDGDGFTENDGDCDDANAAVYPGAADDTQDGVDNDCDGDVDEDYSDPATAAVDLLIAGDLVINEVLQNPCGEYSNGCTINDTEGEWFEIYNATNIDVDLNGLMVTDDGSNSFMVSSSLIIPANGYLVFGNNADSATNGGVAIDFEYSGMTLGNGDDELILSNAGGVIDEIAWDNSATFPDPNGATMSLDPAFMNATDNDTGANWCEATTTFGDGFDMGTPGTANPTCPTQSAALSYSADITPLFSQFGCINCHSYLGSQTVLMSTNSNQVSMPLVTVNDPSQSYLYHKVAGTHASVGGSGTQMPKNQAAMSASQIAMVEQWILDGAQQ